MIQPGDHMTDETLSARIDDQLTPEEARLAQAHLETCAVCRARLDELRSVVGLLQALPSLELPRTFLLGPRLAVDPPNVVRLRRWYGIARAGAASLAAAFVFLAAGALYVGSQPAGNSVSLSARSQDASAPTLAPAAAQPATSPALRAAAPAAPAAAGAPAAGNSGASAGAATQAGGAPPSGVAPGGASVAAPSGAAPAGAAAAATRPKPGTGEEATDQVTAATSVRPLPTLAPTAVPPPPLASRVVQQAFSVTTPDPAAPLRTAAAIAGILAGAGLLATLIVRHRLRAAATTPTE